ncbi:tetratricopeptide repeat protein [Henriciella aquimarina]|uniref:tetratricopeptide repeat protein n=1 Tax=Henriciella aquimarina TaxID=545261 RepID=UPI00117BBD26|nr:tetratricopeptide repeat protein [Henriciella aquimarina]
MSWFCKRTPGFGPGFGVGLALTATIALASACESAPPSSGPVAGIARCTSFTPPSGAPGTVARQCAARADDSDILGRESALAYYHAASAYNALGDYRAAADMAERSFAELATTDSWLTTPPAGVSGRELASWTAPRQTFQADRILQYAEAYSGLADTFGASAATAPSGLCSSRMDCLSKAISRMTAEEGVTANLAGSTTEARSPQYDAYYLQLAKLHEARATAADTEPALTAYQKVASSPLAGPARAEARQALAGLATELGQAAMARGDSGSAGLAIRYFNIAREAQPQDPTPMIGLGNIYFAMASRAGDVDQLHTAEQAYTDALQYAATDAQKAAAYSGRGATRDALASLLGTSREGAIADYQAASQFANSADAYLTLAKACDARGDWACADDNYAKGIARLRGDGAPGSVIAQALIDHAGVRANMAQYSAADVRALLQDASNTAPASADAAIALARHDMRTGNWSAAETTLRRITAGGMENATAYRAEAWAQLSTLAASRPNPDLTEAVTYADEAVKLDSADPIYRRQACIARIYRGGSSVTNSANSAKCSLGTTPEALLLQAMFEMRKAQHVGTNSANRIRRSARDTIDSALATVQPGAMTDFDWPSETTLAPVKTRAILLYLKEASLACGGNYTFNLPEGNGLTAADYAAARNFLDVYKSRLCT